MKYQVVVLRRAELELNENTLWWAENRNVDQAIAWLEEFNSILTSLESDPIRYPVAPEDEYFDFTLRQVLFGISGKRTHRVLFTVRRNQAVIYTIRHLSRDEVKPEDLGIQ